MQKMGVFLLGQNTANSEVNKIIKPLRYINMVPKNGNIFTGAKHTKF
jgi:hypothetical protein